MYIYIIIRVFRIFYRIKKLYYKRITNTLHCIYIVITNDIQIKWKIQYHYSVITTELHCIYNINTYPQLDHPRDHPPTSFIQFAQKIIIKLCIYTNPKIFGLLTICLQIVHTVFINGVYDITMITNKAHAENVIDVSWISLKINQSQIAQNKSIKFVQFAQTLKNLQKLLDK